MNKDEKRKILSDRLAKFRTWSYSELVERVGCHYLEVVEGIASDGTAYQMEFEVFWDDKRGGDVRVCGDLCTLPQRPLFGFLPVYTSDLADSFIMSPDGSFVGENGRQED